MVGSDGGERPHGDVAAAMGVECARIPRIHDSPTFDEGPAPHEGMTYAEHRRQQRWQAPLPRSVWAISPPRPAELDREEDSDDEREQRRAARKDEKRKRRQERERRRLSKRTNIGREENPPALTLHEPGTTGVVDGRNGQHERAVEAPSIRDNEQRLSSDASSEDAMVGPALPSKLAERTDYGKALLPGEGDAMARYVQDGQRIPRRGEIGLKSNEIEKFETAGYVMSGSRNRRMEAVRMRKENQVYSAEERVAMARFNFEAQKEREAKILAQFRRHVERTLGEDDA